jgi:hypothetical protein
MAGAKLYLHAGYFAFFICIYGSQPCGLVTVCDTKTVTGTQVSIIAADVREPSPGSELAPWEWVLSE